MERDRERAGMQIEGKRRGSKRAHIEIQQRRCGQECECFLLLHSDILSLPSSDSDSQREREQESRVTELKHDGETGIPARETGSERRIRGGWKRMRWLHRGEQKREFISSEGEAEVSCSSFTSQAHLNVKMRRGGTIAIKARETKKGD